LKRPPLGTSSARHAGQSRIEGALDGTIAAGYSSNILSLLLKIISDAKSEREAGTLMEYCLLSPARLTPTEEVSLDRVDALQAQILRAGSWTAPIAVEKHALFVMDGYHRLTVAQRLRLAMVPVVLLDYGSVRVEAWRPGESVSPAEIFAMARSGRKFPYKTTRHIFADGAPACDVPLELLISPAPMDVAPLRSAGALS